MRQTYIVEANAKPMSSSQKIGGDEVEQMIVVSGHGRAARPRRLPNRQKGKPKHTYEFVHDRREPAGTAFLGIFRGMRSVEIDF